MAGGSGMGFQLTDEQRAIVETQENRIAITAYAGTGKTATLKALSSSRPRERILYLAFNKAMAEESRVLFAQCRNVEVRTIHSLAFKFEGNQFRDTLGEFKTLDIIPFLFPDCGKNRQKYYEPARDVHDTFIKWLTSSALSLTEFFKKTPFRTRSKETKANVKKLWNACVKGKFSMPHNGYLKLFQINHRGEYLGFDRVMVDEAQDLNDCMIDAVMSRDWAVTLVGDPYQQVYGFNGAVNALGKAAEFGVSQYYLTHSFRCPQDVIFKANQYLTLMGAVKEFTGVDKPKKAGPGRVLVLGRTNAGIFDMVAETMETCAYHFNGGFDTYEFEILLDMVRLICGERVSHPFLKNFASSDDLEIYADSVNDFQTRTRLKIAKRYGNTIFGIYRDMRQLQAWKRDEADAVVSTVHKAKGQEAPHVEMLNDFLSLAEAIGRLQQLVAMDDAPNPRETQQGTEVASFDMAKTMEEFRLLYVAITRTLGTLSIPPEYVINREAIDLFLALAERGGFIR
ncbi:MAG: UvrD-helicase domain-containing protein [Deltaproteobacteria bacterium]|jgi:superfamily I DNA/RNA helicase|nr:UvrD-helicase domain-containing protein [Deltaproteobacteria bacterium]